MSAAGAEHTCVQTGLRLVAARGERAFRVAKDRFGALSVRHNSTVGPLPVDPAPAEGDRRGRFDTIGSTIYLADSRQCAYAEVLVGFRQVRAKVAKVAESISWDVDDYVTRVISAAENNGVDVPWAIPTEWQMDRSIYEVRLPRDGWWVRIDHADTLVALEELIPNVTGMTERLKLLTSGAVEGEDRDLTTLVADVIRHQVIDNGSEPLGISYASKTLFGRCWAYWDRRADEGLSPGTNALRQLDSENVGPDPELARVAAFYNLPVIGTNRSTDMLDSNDLGDQKP